MISAVEYSLNILNTEIKHHENAIEHAQCTIVSLSMQLVSVKVRVTVVHSVQIDRFE